MDAEVISSRLSTIFEGRLIQQGSLSRNFIDESMPAGRPESDPEICTFNVPPFFAVSLERPLAALKLNSVINFVTGKDISTYGYFEKGIVHFAGIDSLEQKSNAAILYLNGDSSEHFLPQLEKHQALLRFVMEDTGPPQLEQRNPWVRERPNNKGPIHGGTTLALLLAAADMSFAESRKNIAEILGPDKSAALLAYITAINEIDDILDALPPKGILRLGNATVTDVRSEFLKNILSELSRPERLDAVVELGMISESSLNQMLNLLSSHCKKEAGIADHYMKSPSIQLRELLCKKHLTINAVHMSVMAEILFPKIGLEPNSTLCAADFKKYQPHSMTAGLAMQIHDDIEDFFKDLKSQRTSGFVSSNALLAKLYANNVSDREIYEILDNLPTGPLTLNDISPKVSRALSSLENSFRNLTSLLPPKLETLYKKAFNLLTEHTYKDPFKSS
jgi:hypothetical protein